MYIIYCLQNESFKETILNFGISSSIDNLNQFIEELNRTFIPTPYTIFQTKEVYDENTLEMVYSLLRKFGKPLNETFFEISPDIVNPLFDLIYDEDKEKEKYRIIQGDIEYVVPQATIEENTYDRLYSFKNYNDDLDL
jgi:hypothetical protein